MEITDIQRRLEKIKAQLAEPAMAYFDSFPEDECPERTDWHELDPRANSDYIKLVSVRDEIDRLLNDIEEDW